MPQKTIRNESMSIKLDGPRYFVERRKGKFCVVEKTIDKKRCIVNERIVDETDSESDAEIKARTLTLEARQ